jgi:hypothetical protein
MKAKLEELFAKWEPQPRKAGWPEIGSIWILSPNDTNPWFEMVVGFAKDPKDRIKVLQVRLDDGDWSSTGWDKLESFNGSIYRLAEPSQITRTYRKRADMVLKQVATSQVATSSPCPKCENGAILGGDYLCEECRYG